MKSLLKNLKAIAQPGQKSIPGISLSLCTSLLTISASVGIGITFNPERSWAGSTCAGVYSSRSGVPTASQSQIGYYNSITKSYVNVATYNGGGNINAIATQPSTGNLFFVNRVTGKTVVYNPNTGSQTTLTGTLPGTTTTIIGATFNPSGNLYVYYSNRTLIQVNPATGSQIGSTISISGIPGNNDNDPGSRTTNGDIAIGTDGVLYAVGDTSSSGGSNYTSQLYSIAISGTTATATPVNGNNVITGVSGAAVNGLAIDPSTNKFYISTSNGTYELDFATKVGTLLTSAIGTNDLAACGSPAPDLPTINKSFSPDTVTSIPATSTLTLTLGNTNLVPIYLIQALTDNFQSGLTVSTPNGLSGTCTTISGNTVTATAGSGLISLNDGFKIPAGGCTVSVNVTANIAGTYTNSIAAGALKTFVGDNANAATSTLSVTPNVSISGTVFGDSDGSKLINGTETGTNAGGLNAVLVNSSNQVVATTVVATNGTYTFSNVPSNANYTVQITTATASVGSTPPAVSLPTNWVSTGENLNGTIDGTVDSKLSVNVTTTNVTGVNLGIERLPNTTDLSPTPQTNPGGTATVQVPTLAGTDPEDGALGSGRRFKIVTLPTNGTLTYNNVAVTAGQIISSYNAALLKLDPNDGAITVSFTYAAIDAAGKEDPTPATVTMPFILASFSVSGTLYEDTDGGDDFDSGEATLPGNITVKLLDSSNNVVATSTTAANGTYTFTNVTNGNYKIKVDTSDTDIPAGYTLGTPNDTAITVSGVNIGNINFGFNQPVASNPNVLLVKRISAINGSSFTNLIDGVKDANSPYYVAQPHDTDDNNGNWPSNYLQGLLNGGTVRPNDEIEYTIYFLSAGDTTANKVLICDRVPENATFIPTAFNNFPTKNTTGLPGSDRGIIWQNNGAIESLTNVSDGDTGEYLSPGIDPTIKYPGIKCDGFNTNGVVVVKLGNVPNATAPGTPINSYGFIRFRGRVK